VIPPGPREHAPSVAANAVKQWCARCKVATQEDTCWFCGQSDAMQVSEPQQMWEGGE
jgi:predicted RNA-binding protein with PUA domain